MTIRHDCKINGCYKDVCIPDWGMFDGCFDAKSEKIKIGDLDGVVEINGNVLFLEWKRMESELSYGQKRLLMTLTENSDKHMALIIYGSINGNDLMKYQTVRSGKFSRLRDCDKEYLRNLLIRWTDYSKWGE
jgi:hypothetical protein